MPDSPVLRPGRAGLATAYQAVRISGWRKGTALISQQPKQLAKIAVKYRDGSRITLKAVPSLHAPHAVGAFSGVPVWVGGAGRDMVVLLPHTRAQTCTCALHARLCFAALDSASAPTKYAAVSITPRKPPFQVNENRDSQG